VLVQLDSAKLIPQELVCGNHSQVGSIDGNKKVRERISGHRLEDRRG
jgi:hypothetical protein